MKISDLVCPACDGRVTDVTASYELHRSATTNQVQTIWATCERGHGLRVGWTPERLEVEVETGLVDVGAASSAYPPEDVIYACPDCPPRREVRLIALEPNRKINPEKPTPYRLECSGCGGWWFLLGPGYSWTRGEGRIPVDVTGKAP